MLHFTKKRADLEPKVQGCHRRSGQCGHGCTTFPTQSILKAVPQDRATFLVYHSFMPSKPTDQTCLCFVAHLPLSSIGLPQGVKILGHTSCRNIVV